MADPFPHSLIFTIPLPTPRLATIIQRALSVDKELSTQVHRTFSTDAHVLTISYKSTTARMLRVAVNGCMESLASVLSVCEELDVDVLEDGIMVNGGLLEQGGDGIERGMVG